MAASEPVSEPHGELHVFTDEKLFTVAVPTNSQNDRFYVRPGTGKKNVKTDSFERDFDKVLTKTNMLIFSAMRHGVLLR